MRKLAIFGSTGSVGEKVLEVVRIFPEDFLVKALGVRRNIDKVLEQAKEFSPKYVYVDEPPESISVSTENLGCEVLTGHEGIVKICNDEEIDTVVVAVDGFSGVFPTVEAIKGGKRVLTANKESIFMWGYEIMNLARENNLEVIPLDSEHNTIFNLVSRVGKENVERYIITASGGPFLNKPLQELEKITISEVMCHPNWKMGKIVTFNSATMFNKVLEVFEAHIFFGTSIEDIEVVIHPESRIHSMVLLKDGTVWTIYYRPDMIFPVASAMFYPRIPRLLDKSVKGESPVGNNIRFLEVDVSRFPLMSIVKDLQTSERKRRISLNVANEICISLFEDGTIRFNQIPWILMKVFYDFSPSRDVGISENLKNEMKEVELEVRNFILQFIQ
ncbi:MAG: 1-deoxy-D-xylulose-5-phosphate reductoisomerase [Brevinematia bacterium]